MVCLRQMSEGSRIDLLRIRLRNDAPVRQGGKFVLYWMIAARRVTHNFALDRAVEWARLLGEPLVILEALRIGYPWASDRLHQFVIEGMADNARRLEGSGVLYYPYVEQLADEGKGLLAALAARAAVVVTDEFPCFFLPRMVSAAERQVPVRFEQVDSNGLVPMRATERVFPTAYSFRRFLQQVLPEHLEHMPKARPFAGAPLARGSLPKAITLRWQPARVDALASSPSGLARLAIDHSVGSARFHGGSGSGAAALRQFVKERLPRYCEQRNEPSLRGTSELSAYLHFGHVSVHEVFAAIARGEGWSTGKLGKANGKREGYWGMSADAEAFLDQIVTWRELGYNMCHKCDDYDQFDSLPVWAKVTLAAHERDRRPHVYKLTDFESASTHDPLWNAAQRQLVRDGWFHNYMRMLWGKKILEWSRSPREALAIMIELMNKYSLDGRDPNSYTGYFWTLGRYDRPWGPERPIFGKVRYMSSENTRRKLDVRPYIEVYASI